MIKTELSKSPFPKEKLLTDTLGAIRSFLNLYGLSDWNARFLRTGTYRCYGLCEYRKKTIAINREFSEIGSDEEILDVILHEIAHALTPGSKHGIAWKIKCLEIGAKPERLYAGEFKTKGNREKCQEIKYVMIDTRSNRVVKRYCKAPSRKVLNSLHRRFLKSDPSSMGHLAIVKEGESF